MQGKRCGCEGRDSKEVMNSLLHTGSGPVEPSWTNARQETTTTDPGSPEAKVRTYAS